jgi:hypothetical protein
MGFFTLFLAVLFCVPALMAQAAGDEIDWSRVKFKYNYTDDGGFYSSDERRDSAKLREIALRGDVPGACVAATRDITNKPTQYFDADTQAAIRKTLSQRSDDLVFTYNIRNFKSGIDPGFRIWAWAQRPGNDSTLKLQESSSKKEVAPADLTQNIDCHAALNAQTFNALTRFTNASPSPYFQESDTGKIFKDRLEKVSTASLDDDDEDVTASSAISHGEEESVSASAAD